MKKLNSNGFGAIEILIIIFLATALGGMGWYILHSKSNANKSNNNANNSQSNTVTTPKKTNASTIPTQKTSDSNYFVIKEWNVKAKNDTDDKFTYQLENGNNLATVISTKLMKEDTSCSSYGAGQISRLKPNDPAYADNTGPTVNDYAKQHPELYVYVAGYYYQFRHDQAACTTKPTVTYSQNDANDIVKQLVAKFQVIN